MSDASAGSASPVHEVFLYLCVRGGDAAIGFYKDLFGAVETFRLQDAEGHVAHAELQLGPTTMIRSDTSGFSVIS